MNLRRRRRTPRTTIGKLIRAWPWIRFGLRVMRFVMRARRMAVTAVLAFLPAALFAATRRRHGGSRHAASVPPAPSTGWGGGTRESGYSAGPGTETERRLEGVKQDE